MMRSFVKTMKALSDPSRVKIVKMLAGGEMCVCELREALGLAQPTVSKHLKVLEEAGLVASRKEGLWVNYRLAAENNYGETMLANLQGWLFDDPEVRETLDKLPSIDRHLLCGGGVGRGSSRKA